MLETMELEAMAMEGAVESAGRGGEQREGEAIGSRAGGGEAGGDAGGGDGGGEQGGEGGGWDIGASSPSSHASTAL